MPCIDRVKGTCPYREAYGCDDGVREIGLQLGRCAREQYWRDEEREKTMAILQYVSVHARDDARDRIERYLDAWMYTQRATTWAGVLFNRPIEEGGGDMAEEEHFRALARYRAAGTNRMFRRFLDLQPVFDDAAENERNGTFERLDRIVQEMKRESAERSKRRI